MDKRVKRYLYINWQKIAASIILGICFSYWIIPELISKPFIRNFFNLRLSATFYLFVSISLLAVSFAYRPLFDFYYRYKNNFKLKEIPFTYVDGVIIFLGTLLVSVSIETIFYLKDIFISREIKLWFVILSLLLFLSYLRILYKSRSCQTEILVLNEKPSNDDYFPDEPINSESEDVFDRKQFVEDLYNRIVRYPFQDSFVFGLYGSWGEGKTSALNLIKNKLYRNKDFIVFEFDPWYYSPSSGLFKGFYDGLYTILNKHFIFPNIKKTFKKYRNLLSSGLKLSGINVDIGVIDESIDDVKRLIENYIQITGKKIVILIDDIDRVQTKNDILQIFQLIKLSAKFNNTIFLLSFDQKIISSYLYQELSDDPSYLEKIIQAPTYLPATEQTMIDNFLYYSHPDQGQISGIDRLFQKLKLESERVKAFDDSFTNLYESKIKKLFKTLRQAKRFLNSIYMSLPSIKNEVNLYDFMILEVIKNIYPDVYEDIWRHSEYYIPSDWSLKTYGSLGLDKKQRNNKIKEYIMKTVENREDPLLELLQTIFFVNLRDALEGSTTHYEGTGNYRAEKRITHPDVFPKYFTMKVPSTELSDQEIEAMLGIWNETDPEDIESKISGDIKRYQENKKLLDLLTKLNIFLPRFEVRIVKPFIRAIYKNIKEFSDAGSELFWTSEFDRAQSLVLHLINEKAEKNEIEPLLIEIIQNTSSVQHAVSIVVSSRKERGGSLFNIYDSINRDNLQKELSQRLHEYYIINGRDIFLEEGDEKKRYAFILYQWGTLSLEDRSEVNKYIFSLIEKHPNYIGKIVVMFIDRIRSFEENIQYDELSKLLDDEALYKLIEKQRDNAYSNQEEKKAIDLFVKAYEKREKVTRQETNKTLFLDALNKQGRDNFNKGDYKAALIGFNRALAMQGWDDEHDWKAEALYEKWKCLLELAWNNDEPMKNYLEHAYVIAKNERQISDLIARRYGDGRPDKAPIEFYYCLFYYLQWYFADSDQKPSIKENFDKHYTPIASGGVAGWNEELKKRFDELMKRISQ